MKTVYLLSLLFFINLMCSCSNEMAFEIGNDQELPDVSVQFQISDGVALTGDQICLDITTKHFEDILSAQFSIGWNKNILRYNSVKNFGLPDLSIDNFIYPNPRRLTFSWSDPEILGISLADGARLFQVCFDVNGDVGTSTRVKLTNDPKMMELMNNTFTILDIKKKKSAGTVLVE